MFKKKKEETKEEVNQKIEKKKEMPKAPKHKAEKSVGDIKEENLIAEEPVEEKPETPAKTYQVAEIATQTQPILVNTKTKENYGEMYSILAEILNRLEAIELILKEVQEE